MATPVSDNLVEFITTLKTRGVTFGVDGQELRYSAPDDALTSDDLGTLRERKTEILALLRSVPSPPVSRSAPTLKARSLEGPLAMSYAQQALVESYRTLESPLSQHSKVIRRLIGPLDVDALRRSLLVLAQRHAVLRSRYLRGCDERWVAVIDRPADIELELVDVGAADDRDAAARASVTDFRARRFDLESGPLWRARLIRLSPTDHVLVIVLHHSISDAWSLRVLFRDLGTSYAALVTGDSPRLSALSVQFPDYARWLRDWLQSSEANAHREYWRGKLRGLEQPFWLPRDAPLAGDAYRQEGLKLDATVLAALRALAKRERTTPAAIVLTAFAIVLARWSGRPDVLVAVLHFGRRQPQLLNVIGCFMQAWVLRLNAGGDRSFVELLRDVRTASLEAQEHLEVPFYELKKEFASASDEKPLLHITLNYLRASSRHHAELTARQQPSADGHLCTDDFPLDNGFEPLDEGRGEKLVLYFTETDDSLSGMLRYSPLRYSRQTIDAFWIDLQTLLETTAATPEFADGPLPHSALELVARS